MCGRTTPKWFAPTIVCHQKKKFWKASRKSYEKNTGVMQRNARQSFSVQKLK